MSHLYFARVAVYTRDELTDEQLSAWGDAMDAVQRPVEIALDEAGVSSYVVELQGPNQPREVNA
jgi:hypothetical protein